MDPGDGLVTNRGLCFSGYKALKLSPGEYSLNRSLLVRGAGGLLVFGAEESFYMRMGDPAVRTDSEDAHAVIIQESAYRGQVVQGVVVAMAHPLDAAPPPSSWRVGHT